MARKDLPYLPLYIQDFMTDEQLVECSAASTGVFIRIMCILHKQRPYGTILLKQKDKQKDKQIENFALKFVKQLPWEYDVILAALTELIQEGCLKIEEDTLYQKRMLEDGKLSDQRALAGKNGAETKKKFAEAKPQATPDIDIDNDNSNTPISGKFSDFNLVFTDTLKQSCLEILSIAQFGTDKKITKAHVENLFTQFCEIQKSSTEWYKDEDAVWVHFKRWLPKQKINGTDKSSIKHTTKFNQGANELLQQIKSEVNTGGK